MDLLLLDLLKVDAPGELFGNKFYDEDLWEFITRFFLSTITCYIVIKTSYNKGRRSSEYTFSYYVFAILIFFTTNMLAAVKIKTGFALGLFAIFAILRYRTIQIPIREMTYLFVIIAVSVINAMSVKKVSWAELMFANVSIVALTYYLEATFSRNKVKEQFIEYERIENIKPDRREEMMADLKERTGLDILDVEIERTDFLRDTARIKIMFREHDD